MFVASDPQHELEMGMHRGMPSFRPPLLLYLLLRAVYIFPGSDKPWFRSTSDCSGTKTCESAHLATNFNPDDRPTCSEIMCSHLVQPVILRYRLEPAGYPVRSSLIQPIALVYSESVMAEHYECSVGAAHLRFSPEM